jgi:hypothetical protein
LPVTEVVAERWGHLAATAKQHGLTLTVVDGVIAATALHHDLTLVTRNVKDFAGLGIRISNPWEILRPRKNLPNWTSLSMIGGRTVEETDPNSRSAAEVLQTAGRLSLRPGDPAACNSVQWCAAIVVNLASM